MFLSTYHVDGDPAVLDGCASRAAFEAFSTGEQFRSALAAAGLPTPRVQPLGEVHAVRADGGMAR